LEEKDAHLGEDDSKTIGVLEVIVTLTTTAAIIFMCIALTYLWAVDPYVISI
jgi:hypothetical protein